MNNHGPLKLIKKLLELFKRSRSQLKHPTANAESKNIHHIKVVFIPWHNVAWINRLNAHLIKKQLLRKTRETIDVTDTSGVLTWICNPTDTIVELLSLIRGSTVIYDIAMRFSKLPDAPAYIVESQNALAQKADIIIYDSKASLGDLPTEIHNKAHYIPQGFNEDFFSYNTDQESLEHIPRPRLGYMGAINNAFDVALVAKIAKSLPQTSIVMIGETSIVPEELKHDNIHFVGHRDIDHIPKILRSLDAGLIPYIVNEFTAGTFPTKMFEYMMAGLPVITTALPEMLAFKNHLMIARNYEEFVALAKEATTKKTKRIPQDFLQHHTWKKRFEDIENIFSKANV